MADHQIFDLGTVILQSGAALRDAKLAYRTFGALAPKKDNLVLFPAGCPGWPSDDGSLIGEGMTLDPARYFIVVPSPFGGGLSSSPSNTSPPYDRARFPEVTIHDNVRCQIRLVTERFDVKTIKLVTGRSMGALQAFQWGSLYPEMVERILPFCGAARCSRYSFVLLEGAKAALTADATFDEGWYERPPTRGLRAMARVCAGWGASWIFYRERLDMRELDHPSLSDFLIAYWEGHVLSQDANDLFAQLRTWQTADISANDTFEARFEEALGAIKAKAIVMPARGDLLFPPEDSEYEVRHMPNAKLRPIESEWGHLAGRPGTDPKGIRFVDDALRELLAQ